MLCFPPLYRPALAYLFGNATSSSYQFQYAVCFVQVIAHLYMYTCVVAISTGVRICGGCVGCGNHPNAGHHCVVIDMERKLISTIIRNQYRGDDLSIKLTLYEFDSRYTSYIIPYVERFVQWQHGGMPAIGGQNAFDTTCRQSDIQKFDEISSLPIYTSIFCGIVNTELLVLCPAFLPSVLYSASLGTPVPRIGSCPSILY